MKWLVINTESFSPKGLKQKTAISPSGRKARKDASFEDLPWVVRKFLSVFKSPFIILDECSKIKTNVPMKENDKSSRTRTIKLLNKFGDRMIMTGTLMSKSPLNVMDPYEFLREGYFPESMWEFAEKYCVMETIRVGRGRRVLIGQKDYEAVRKRLKNAYVRGGEMQLEAAKCGVYRQYGIDYAKQEHIIRHRKYSPFINQGELMRRIAGDTVFVKREDMFDIKYDKFVKEPIMRPVELSAEAKRIANELVDLGFTNKLVLGKAPALELLIRLQDVCNGFEPVKEKVSGAVSHIPLKENAKVDALLELLEEIDVEKNQVVVWSSRRLLVRACADAFAAAGIAHVVYDGDADDKDKEEAEKKFKEREVQVFLANQASGAYGLNCLAGCAYAVWMCVDGSVEKYCQARDRILRGQLAAPKFAYAIYAKGTVEERQWEALRIGQELVSAENCKETFTVA
jgi:SNF2 family DNA or RNA helicase